MKRKSLNDIEIRYPDDFGTRVDRDPEEETCVSVGGLARVIGLTDSRPAPAPTPSIGPTAFARMVEFWRRKQRLTVLQLAERAGLDEADVLDAERGDTVPDTRVLYALAQVLDVSYDKLLHLTGSITERDEHLEQAAVRFAASSEPMDQLNADEEEALHAFINSLAQ